jgi:hypothetical protein
MIQLHYYTQAEMGSTRLRQNGKRQKTAESHVIKIKDEE